MWMKKKGQCDDQLHHAIRQRELSRSVLPYPGFRQTLSQRQIAFARHLLMIDEDPTKPDKHNPFVVHTWTIQLLSSCLDCEAQLPAPRQNLLRTPRKKRRLIETYVVCHADTDADNKRLSLKIN